jgi:hypothetical protein
VSSVSQHKCVMKYVYNFDRDFGYKMIELDHINGISIRTCVTHVFDTGSILIQIYKSADFLSSNIFTALVTRNT